MRAAIAVAVTLSGALASAPAAAQGKPATRTLVYVDDVAPADRALAADATALTSALCAAIAKDARLDVLCAPDVRQILQFAATAAMIGTAGSPSNAVTERLDRTQLVVAASLKKDGATWVLVLKGGPKASDANPAALYTDRPIVALEQRADSQKKLLDALPGQAARLAEGLLKPASSPPAPPAPLGDSARPGG
jgi:hypothetical protein